VSLDLHDARFVKLAPFAIHSSNSPDFAIRRTEVRSWDNTFTAWQTDNGVSVHDSHGLIEDFYGGPNIDHIIDVVNSDLVVRRADLEGSSIGYADGIRSINTRLTVEDCEIHRALFPPRSSASQHLSDGGIEIIFSLEQPETYQVRIEGNTIRGWRDGLYIYADQHDFLVQNNDFESNGNPVYSTDREHAIRLEPCGGPGCPGANTVVIDLGGGALGGGGGNAFGEDERFTVHNTMTVDVPAYHNDWGVTDPVEIELRIHDGEDDPQVGRVLYQLNSGM
jgi:parallel beta-helix repeat protein